jgi:hypothetical protein
MEVLFFPPLKLTLEPLLKQGEMANAILDRVSKHIDGDAEAHLVYLSLHPQMFYSKKI